MFPIMTQKMYSISVYKAVSSSFLIISVLWCMVINSLFYCETLIMHVGCLCLRHHSSVGDSLAPTMDGCDSIESLMCEITVIYMLILLCAQRQLFVIIDAIMLKVNCQVQLSITNMICLEVYYITG